MASRNSAGAETWYLFDGLNVLQDLATAILRQRPACGKVLDVKTHQEIDRRSLALAHAVVAAIDGDPEGNGLRKARANCSRWYREGRSAAIAEWIEILKGEWAAIRQVLLDEGEEGQRLRQSSPFCGILSPRERWVIYIKNKLRGLKKEEAGLVLAGLSVCAKR